MAKEKPYNCFCSVCFADGTNLTDWLTVYAPSPELSRQLARDAAREKHKKKGRIFAVLVDGSMNQNGREAEE